MRIQRKHNHCHNCKTILDGTYNYCPLCGQLNNDNNVSFSTLFTDFFSNYFALDSRFVHSFIPFFIKPGHLTNQFNVGKRMSYANPVRLYLIVSVFFFFIFSGVGKKIIANDDNDHIVTSSNKSSNASSTIGNIDELTEKDLEELKETLNAGFKPVMKTLSKKDKKKLIDKLGAEKAAKFYLLPEDTITSKKKSNKEKDMDFLGDGKFNWELYNDELKDNDDLSETEILDSIYLGGADDLELLVAKQRIKVERTEGEYFVGFALKNLPIMMFLLLPLFALILKLLYIRRKVFYIKHLIHALHLHAFAYLIYGITLLVSFYLVENEDWSVFLNIGAFILVSTYAYISFLRVYKQHWFKTLVKFNIQGMVYSVLLMLFFTAELGISFLLY